MPEPRARQSPMRQGHYYTPRPVKMGPGVKRSTNDAHSDLYAGSAETLERAGVLQADMLPAPGHVGISWRPANMQKTPGVSVMWVPGYMEIRRHHDGTYRARLTVSREEQAVRKAAENERERHRQADAQRRSEATAKERQEATKALMRQAFKGMSPATFRDYCMRDIELLGKALGEDADHNYPLRFGPAAMGKMAALLDQLAALVRDSEVVPRRPENATRGRLRLAWSAS
jgi:hypothetical protein